MAHFDSHGQAWVRELAPEAEAVLGASGDESEEQWWWEEWAGGGAAMGEAGACEIILRRVQLSLLAGCD